VLQPIIQQSLGVVAGQRIVAFQPPPLPGHRAAGAVRPRTTEPFAQLNDVTQSFLHDALASGCSSFLDHRSAHRQPAGDSRHRPQQGRADGPENERCRRALGALLGGGYVNYFGLDGGPIKSFLRCSNAIGSTRRKILDYHVSTASGASVHCQPSRA